MKITHSKSPNIVMIFDLLKGNTFVEELFLHLWRVVCTFVAGTFLHLLETSLYICESFFMCGRFLFLHLWQSIYLCVPLVTETWFWHACLSSTRKGGGGGM